MGSSGRQAVGNRLQSFFAEWSWPKIIGETLIVIVGVFLGVQASNWNDARIERRETGRLLQALKPEMRNQLRLYRTIDDYYAVTRRYADTAIRGWAGDARVSDRDFVIAAYQASQNYIIASSSGSWAQIFGSDRLRDIDDATLRQNLGLLMTLDYGAIERDIFTDYRRNVRMVLPVDVQDAVRAECGDQRISGTPGFIRLPGSCAAAVPGDRFAVAARELRGHPELAGQLRWHLSAIATYLGNVETLRATSAQVLQRIESGAS